MHLYNLQLSFLYTLFLSLPLSQLPAQSTEMIYTVVDQMPYFPGCEVYANGSKEKRNCSNDAVVAYIANTLTYPTVAKEEGLEGITYISFIINKKGEVVQPKVLRDIGGGCGEEAITVVRSMPIWEAGRLRDEPVAVQLKLPIHFQFIDKDLSSNYTIKWGTLTNYEVSRKQLRRQLEESVDIVDMEGERVPLASLSFSYNKNNKVASIQSNGSITPQMQQFIKKMKKGSLFSIIGSIQKGGTFVEIDKEFMIVR